MTKNSQILDDIARVAGGAVGMVNNLREQLQNDIKARVEEMATRMDLVPREDLDRVEALLQKTIADQESIIARLNTLEGKAGTPAKKQKTKTKSNTATKTVKKTAKKKATKTAKKK